MEDIKIDPLTGDIELNSTTGIPLQVSEREALGQRLLLAMATWRGDWVFNVLRGIPYDQVLGEPFNLPARTLLRESILRDLQRVKGVQVVQSVEFDFQAQSRALSITVSVLGMDGEEATNTVGLQI